jgi:hypothetical protein
MKFPYRTVSEITPDLHGLYKIDHEAYHRGPGLSSTQVKKALISHAVFSHKEHKDSDAMAFGRAFHMALLEPELYEKTYVLAPRFDAHPNSKAYKSARQEWALLNTGKEVIYPDEALAIVGMITAVKCHLGYANIPRFDAEIMAITTDLDTGLKVKCKADLFGHAIIDFKTTSSGLGPGDFLNDIIKWRYHVSAAFYQDIICNITGERLPFIVVPVTKKEPYECEYYRLSDEILEEGRKLYKAALRRIVRWEKFDPIVDKKMRVLMPNARMLYTTIDTLAFIEGP